MSFTSRMHSSSKACGVAFCFALTLLVAPSLFSQSTGTTQSPNVSLPGTQSPFLGSNPEGTATQQVLQIDFKDAIDRGLRNNLGLLLAGDQTEAARGERWKQLAELLPNLSAHVLENAENQSLAALGFTKLLPLFGSGSSLSSFPRVIAGLQLFRRPRSLSANRSSISRIWRQERAASESLKAAQLTYKDAREIGRACRWKRVLAIDRRRRASRDHRGPGQERPSAQRQGSGPTESRIDSGDRRAAIPGRTANAPATVHCRAQRFGETEFERRAHHWVAARTAIRSHGESPVSGADSTPLETYLQRAYAAARTIRRPLRRSAVPNCRAAPHRPDAIPTVDLGANFG